MPLRSPAPTTPTAALRQRRAQALVERYLRLYEQECWPPAGPLGTDRISAAARRQVVRLQSLVAVLWEALPPTESLPRRTLLRRTAAAGSLRERRLALRLGLCMDRIRRERGTDRLRRVPAYREAPAAANAPAGRSSTATTPTKTAPTNRRSR